MRLPVLFACVVALGGCSVDMAGFSFVSDSSGTRTSTATASVSTPVPRSPEPRVEGVTLTADGECTSETATRPLPSEIANGITECELLKLKGARPTDVLIGESGKGQRETQVLYAEPGGRELYMFTDNKLSRIVKPGQG